MRSGRGFKKLSVLLGLAAALALVVFVGVGAAGDGSSLTNCPDVSIGAPLTQGGGGNDCNNPPSNCPDVSIGAPLTQGGGGNDCNNPPSNCPDVSIGAPLTQGGGGNDCNNPPSCEHESIGAPLTQGGGGNDGCDKPPSCNHESIGVPLTGNGGDNPGVDDEHGCATIELKKQWVGSRPRWRRQADDCGRQAGDRYPDVAAPDYGTTDPSPFVIQEDDKSVDVTLSETFTKGLPADYTSTITCLNDKQQPIEGLNGAALVDGSVDVTVKDHDNVVCTITNSKNSDGTTPPPEIPNVTAPVGPPPAYDVQVTKMATKAINLPAAGGTGTISYTITVGNNGPNAVHNVVFTDSAPAGVTFTQVSDGKGCVLAANAVTCNLGGIATGHSIQLTIWATVTAQTTSSFTNIGSAFGKDTDRNDTNLNNNTSQATTTVNVPAPGSFTPPVSKPEAKPIVICNAIAATPKVLRADGKKQVVMIHVTKLIGRTVASAKKVPAGGIRVLISGAGIQLFVVTNNQGVAVANIAPSKAGLIKLRITNKKACNSLRLGAAGVYEPTVTG